jgi:hypothetical protein
VPSGSRGVRDRLRSFNFCMGCSIGSHQRRWTQYPRRRPIASSCGTSSEDVLIPTERHPAYRQREARSGSGTERENLAGDAKGKGASGSNREAESTDAPERSGLPRSSDEAAVMVVERRGQVIAVGLGQPATGGTRHSTEGGSLRAVARAG